MKAFTLGLIFFSSHLFGLKSEHFISSDLGEGKFSLEDGSIWSIDDKDQHKLSMFMDSPLSFLTDESWLSHDVKCCLQNTNNNRIIQIELLSAPKVYDSKSHWIAYIEPKKSILFLDNGVIFSLYDNDREYFKNWLADDFVIIGDYKSILSGNKQVLFNYRTKEFVFGEVQ